MPPLRHTQQLVGNPSIHCTAAERRLAYQIGRSARNAREFVWNIFTNGEPFEVTVAELEPTGVATDPFGNVRAGFEGETEISRKDFGLTWNVALEAGGVLVSDKIKIQLDVSAIKSA